MKGPLDSLRKMQRRACLWITSAFKTSPMGAAETLAGVPPTHLHVKKLVEWSHIHTCALQASHTFCRLVDGDHKFSVETLKGQIRGDLKPPITGGLYAGPPIPHGLRGFCGLSEYWTRTLHGDEHGRAVHHGTAQLAHLTNTQTSPFADRLTAVCQRTLFPPKLPRHLVLLHQLCRPSTEDRLTYRSPPLYHCYYLNTLFLPNSLPIRLRSTTN
jgi:hypothetical protein